MINVTEAVVAAPSHPSRSLTTFHARPERGAQSSGGRDRATLELLDARTSEDARLVRGVAYRTLALIDAIHRQHGSCLGSVADQDCDPSTRFLARWLALLPRLIELRDLMWQFDRGPMTQEGIP